MPEAETTHHTFHPGMLRSIVLVFLCAASGAAVQQCSVGFIGADSIMEKFLRSFLIDRGCAIVPFLVPTEPDFESKLSKINALLFLHDSGSATTGLDKVATWVREGGRLVSVWDGADWTLNMAALLGTTRDSKNSANMDENTAVGVHLPDGTADWFREGVQQDYLDQERTNWFRKFETVDDNVKVLATWKNEPVALFGSSGVGSVVVLGFDIHDSWFQCKELAACPDSKTILFNSLRVGELKPPTHEL